MDPEIADAPIECVIELANTPFTLSSFRHVWERFAGSWERSHSDVYGFNVLVGTQGYPLWIDPLGSRIISARLRVCYLDDWSDGGMSAGSDRATFDSALARLSDRVRSLLGPPALEWCDKDKVAYRAAIWAGAHGVLIAQQGAIDSQYGDEVCLATENLSLRDFTPADNLARWQCERSQRLHDADGFPPLAE
jgi:hypothetical protein